MEFGTCWPLSVEFNSESVRDRGNLLTNYWKLSAQSLTNYWKLSAQSIAQKKPRKHPTQCHKLAIKFEENWSTRT